jgi:ribosomal protein S4
VQSGRCGGHPRAQGQQDLGGRQPGLANIPPHLEFDKAKMTAKVNGRIAREWVALEINELLVVEFYSRKV